MLGKWLRRLLGIDALIVELREQTDITREAIENQDRVWRFSRKRIEQQIEAEQKPWKCAKPGCEVVWGHFHTMVESSPADEGGKQ